MEAIFISLVEESVEIFWGTYVVSDAFIEQNKKVSGIRTESGRHSWGADIVSTDGLSQASYFSRNFHCLAQKKHMPDPREPGAGMR